MTSVEDLIAHIETAVKNAENKISKVLPGVFDIQGYTGHKTLHFYNNLMNKSDLRYLEIGTWGGSSTCAALCNNSFIATCVDNWSEFGGPRDMCIQNIDRYKGNNTVTFIENDCWAIDVSKIGKFNIYMYDACHKRASHCKALTHYINAMDEVFIYVVDDWDWKDVQRGTYDAISSLNLKILYKKEIHMIDDQSEAPCASSKENWWNGVGIFLLKK